MLVLRVRVNEEPPVVAGANDLGVLNAIVSAVGKLGDDAQHPHPDEPPDIHLTVGGLTARAAGAADEHKRWLELRDLSVGDKVTVEVLEATSADTVESGRAAESRGHDEREYFELCKRIYLELKGKYEVAD